MMLEVVNLAEMYRQNTEGSYEPLLLNALIQAGYDQSFENLNGNNGRIDSENKPSFTGESKPIIINNIEVDSNTGAGEDGFRRYR